MSALMAALMSVVFLSSWMVISSVPADAIRLTGEECTGEDCSGVPETFTSLLQLGHFLESNTSHILLRTTAGNFASAVEASTKQKMIIKLPTSTHQKPRPHGLRNYLAVYGLWCMLLAILILLKPACSLVLTKIAAQLNGAVETQIASLSSKQDDEARRSSTDWKVCEPYDLLPCPMSDEACLLDELPDSDQPAIAGSTVGSPLLTYTQLRQVMADEIWDVLNGFDVVAFALPPGTELATTLVCLLNRTTCAPLDPNLSTAECVSALNQFNARALVVVRDAAPGACEAAVSMGLPTFSLLRSTPNVGKPSLWKLWPMSVPSQSVPFQKLEEKPIMSGGKKKDIALLLMTSGTTGKSKVVPLRLRQLVHGAKMIAASIDLGPNDACLNAMPLFHIGGISCNLLGTLLSGGLVICCEKRFEPRAFADLMPEGKLAKQPTWYYSSPSMHLALVDAGAVGTHSLRLVRSAAAAMPPLLQVRLEQFFQCEVVATYGMTECMPIASPVLQVDANQHGPHCQPLGSVGRPIGPSVEILNGEVMIRGPLVTTGYLDIDCGWTDQGLFPTGDLGRLDENGFLWILGRRKEVINQGGETLAPQELEEQAVGHKDVKEVAAYPVAHHRLGEAVALAVVLENGQNMSSSRLLEIADEIAMRLAPGRRPAVLAFMTGLARTNTGKLQRLANPRVELSDADRRMVVLDGRACRAGVHAVSRISPEPNTLAGIYEETSKDKLGSSRGDATEFYDSLGILQKLSQCQIFETRVFLNMYVLGVVGITLTHMDCFANDKIRHMLFSQNADVSVVLSSVRQNSWHLGMFFIGAGYLDSKYNHQLGFRDLVIFTMIPGIPIVGSLMPYSTSGWNTFDHPARWFFPCMLVCRLYVVFCERMSVPKPLQALMIVPLATWLQMVQRAAALSSQPYPTLHYVNKFLLSTYSFRSSDEESQKVARSTIAYVLAYLFLAAIVRKAVSKGPYTVFGERLLGLFCWGVFISAGIFIKEQHWTLAIELTPQLKFSLPNCLLYDFCVVCVLGVANAYLPIQLPDCVVNSLFSALLLMPLNKTLCDSELMSYMVSSSSGAMQLCGFVSFMGIYLGVICPVFQAVAMMLSGRIVGFATWVSYSLKAPKFSETSDPRNMGGTRMEAPAKNDEDEDSARSLAIANTFDGLKAHSGEGSALNPI